MMVDLHVHTRFSPDADPSHGNVPIELCRLAQERGISHLAFADHYDIDTVEGINCDLEDAYMAVQQAKELYDGIRGAVVPLAGLELAHAHVYSQDAAAVLRARNYDFILGSMHELGGKMEFSTLKLECYSDSELKALFEQYLQELYEIADRCDFDSLAHAAYPIRYYCKQGRGDVIRLEDYADAYVRIFRRLIERGKALEVNTSDLFGPLHSTLPPYSLLSLYRSVGGELFTVGSDSHEPATLGAGIRDAYSMLRALGVSHTAVFVQRSLVMCPIDN